MKKPKKAVLSSHVRKTLAEHGGKQLEHRHVLIEVSSTLIEKLRIPEETKLEAKKLAVHNARLHEAAAVVSFGSAVSIKDARKIIEITLEEIPGFAQRNKEMGNAQKRQLRELEATLKQDIEMLKGVPDEKPTTLSLAFLEDAETIHFDRLKALLGEKNFRLFNNAMRRTMKVLRQRGNR